MLHGERNNILIVTLSNIGDVILTTPVIASLRALHPDAAITVVVGPKAQDLFRGSRMIDQLVIYDKRAPLMEKISFLSVLRRKDYDLVIDLRNTAIPFLVKTRKRSPLVRKYSQINMRERHLEVLRMTGVATKDGDPFDFFSDADLASALDKLANAGVRQSRWISLAAGAASEAKRWPLANYAKVIDKLLQITEDPVVLVGDTSERLYMEPLRQVAPKRIHNLAGITTLRESAAIVSQSSLVLSNDSAVMHLGFELNKNVVAVFGPTDPYKYGRRGPHFRVVFPAIRTSDQHPDPFQGIIWENVFDACRELLGKEAASSHEFF